MGYYEKLAEEMKRKFAEITAHMAKCEAGLHIGAANRQECQTVLDDALARIAERHAPFPTFAVTDFYRRNPAALARLRSAR